ncbi:MAG: acyl-CoA thioesterase [Chryseobacterium sp.]|nr:acyl-CoA thioesterase [Candidatus Chryseobacterium enterohippi]
MENEVSTKVKIRFSDCDPIGHLNNVKYLDYMFNAREDHVETFYGFTYEEYTKRTGCTWVTIQNEIAYLKELKYNTQVIISSKMIDIQDRTSKIEIIMKSLDGKTIHAVLWVSLIYFNMKTRKSEVHPKELTDVFSPHYVDLDQKDFQSRIKYFRSQNAKNLS